MSLIRTLAKAVLPPPLTIRLRAAFKQHEPERALLPALCDPARVGLDIGAALGAYTWPLSRLCASCIAFEPNPDQARYLRRALGRRSRVENLALSDQDGEVELVIPLGHGDDQAGLATIAPGPWLDGKPVRRVNVAMRTLDSLSLPAVGFIKLDVEGHELAVLRGARRLLARDRPTLLVELEERFGEGSIARLRDFVAPLAYRGLYLDGKRLHAMADFDPALNQQMAHWGTPGAYINNFIFVPQDGFGAARQHITRLGYTVEV
jgi:FkbM family methyltransferase